MSAELKGLDEFTRAAARVAKAIEDRTRGVAERTAGRVADGIRARVRYRTGINLRNNVAVEAHPAQRHFLVGFRDVTADDRTGRNPMIPVWHEFGTRKMAANPAVGNSLNAERTRYEAEMREALEGGLKEMR